MFFELKNEFLHVKVNSKGAELWSILAQDGTEYLWQGDSKYWADRALNIFPFVGRLTNGLYEIDGTQYSLNIHGFAWTTEFTCKEQTDTRLVMELCHSEETLAQYPRKFCFRVIYELCGKAIKYVYEVENLDSRTLYFGLGGHPGFNVPLVEGKRHEDYRLRFAEKAPAERVGFTAACFLDGTFAPFELKDGTVLDLRHDLYDDDAIVLQNMCREVTLETPDDGHYVRVRYPQMPYLGIWHRPKTDAPYVCIEPWMSLPSAQDEIAVMEERKDILHLEAGKTYRNEWEIEIGF